MKYREMFLGKMCDYTYKEIVPTACSTLFLFFSKYWASAMSHRPTLYSDVFRFPKSQRHAQVAGLFAQCAVQVLRMMQLGPLHNKVCVNLSLCVLGFFESCAFPPMVERHDVPRKKRWRFWEHQDDVVIIGSYRDRYHISSLFIGSILDYCISTSSQVKYLFAQCLLHIYLLTMGSFKFTNSNVPQNNETRTHAAITHYRDCFVFDQYLQLQIADLLNRDGWCSFKVISAKV